MTEAKTILDVGCYTADFLKLLAYLGYTCTGTDIHKSLMEKMNKESNGNPEFKFCTSENLCCVWGDKFDVVMMLDVLEHCLAPMASINSIEAVAKPGGLIIINLPRVTPFYKDEALEHLRMFSDTDIKRIFGNKKNYKFELCQDELGRDTSFITYNK